ncbi:hypothetical protein L6452_42992 [Arctium lappa]|uniref:Uncharacterized protein n=1 Tax=Arctium lappa TaxID=4217 RepID=A0ACB8XL02_ARCLA|nr:hypothetical protein L6452_42992 [Arctium lappa]
MEVVVEQRRPEVDTDVEDASEAGGLQSRRKSRHQYSGTAIVHGLTKGDNGGGEPSDNNAYLDENGGALEDLDVHKIPIFGQYDANQAINSGITETASASSEGTVESLRSGLTEEEIVEEEVVELEFEKAIHKLHTHTMHCPNCDAQITKVVLRRKVITARRPRRTPIDELEKPIDLLGCLSCFRLFTSTGNPFSIFREKPRMNAVAQPDGNEEEIATGNCFSIFQVFRNGPNVPIIEDNTKPGFVDSPSPSPASDTKYVPSKPPGEHGKSLLDVTPENPESSIDIPPATSPATGAQTQGLAVEQDSTSFEILKSVVYGGLMEVIASLSVVASANAADATTLTIVSLALANLIGGIFVIGHNLWDLRDDCYKSSSQQTNQVTRNKYKELLGRVEHFPLHAFFMILSFFVFGIIPPVAYGYSFHETNNKDFTIVVVAAASLVCVGLLAIFKAYVDRCTDFLGYVKTIAYYLTTAIAVSGVSYVVGNLVTRLIKELGLFETTSGVAMSLLHETNPSLAYY